MDLPAALVADLARLGEGSGPTARGLDELLRSLTGTAATVVPSFLGLTATATRGTDAFTAVLLEAGTVQEQVRSSVRIPFGAGGSVVLLASAPGALVDLAADVAVALGVPPGSVAVDTDLELPDADRPHRDLAELSVVHQAIGVLLARGRTVEQARAELVRRGAGTGGGTVGAARALVASLGRGGAGP